MSHKVKFSKRWSTLFEDVIQYLLLRGRAEKRKEKRERFQNNILYLLIYVTLVEIILCRKKILNVKVLKPICILKVFAFDIWVLVNFCSATKMSISHV